jgi:hypothetical protein
MPSSGCYFPSLLALDVGQSRNTLCMVMNAEDYLRLNHFLVDDCTNNSSMVHSSQIHRPERRPASPWRKGVFSLWFHIMPPPDLETASADTEHVATRPFRMAVHADAESEEDFEDFDVLKRGSSLARL